MKIAITSTGQTLDSQVDPRFGRAACFIIIDTETMDFSAIENSNIAAAGGAGISSAKAVIDAGVQAVLTGNCGPNAERTLSAGKVKLYTGVTGTVSEAVELFKSDKLPQADGPSVQSHFGTGN
ncbi:NifB/NifX family molybdenum-iron cluster-binding protein [Planctomycetota bacterium]